MGIARMWVMVCLAASTAACKDTVADAIDDAIPTGGGPTGSLTGTLAGAPITASIDATSVYLLERRETCEDAHVDMFDLSYGEGALALAFRLHPRVTALGTSSYQVPDDTVVTVEVPLGASATGTIQARVTGVLARRTGSFELALDDGSTVQASFDLPFDAAGPRLDCDGDGEIDVDD